MPVATSVAPGSNGAAKAAATARSGGGDTEEAVCRFLVVAAADFPDFFVAFGGMQWRVNDASTNTLH